MLGMPQSRVRGARSALVARFLFCIGIGLLSSGARAAAQEQGKELEAFVARERAQAALLLRRGRVDQALELVEEHLADNDADQASRLLRAACRLARGDYQGAREDAGIVLAAARASGDHALEAGAARDLAGILLVVGEPSEAQSMLDLSRNVLDPAADARDAWVLARTAWENGDRASAKRLYEQGIATSDDQSWDRLLARARCERALGRLERASQTLAQADDRARKAEGTEPDVLAELGSLYFESEHEVEAGGKRPAADLFREAIQIAPGHEQALLGLFELHRVNYNRQSRPAADILKELLDARPASIEAHIAEVDSALDDGQLVTAREGLAWLRERAAGRREVRTLEASLAWIEHRNDDCRSILGDLARVSSEDSRPECEVGRHLNELFRFTEARTFLEHAVELDPSDYEAWRELGEALANTGMEEEGLAALQKSEVAARGRQDAWRNNTIQVLERMQTEHVIADFGELSFSWRPDEEEILRTYLVPFYRRARSDLAARYGFTPGPTRIEVFRRFEDFSVRSVGFSGFPALGVCFGPVVTAVSPLSELRGTFSWARTSYHEFTHVIHLGLSHNRCPRWITEGLATWEEEQRNPSWTRNMRRDLLDARANGDLIPLRELNRAFRGPRILFAYYQGGLLCEMLVDAFGFPPIVRLLEAFDRGLDLDQAFAEDFSMTPEEVDQRFQTFVDGKLSGLALEPRWTESRLAALRFSLPRQPPADPAARAKWAQDLCTLAWGSHQAGRSVDAQEALRRIDAAGEHPFRARFLRGELALGAKQRDEAHDIWMGCLNDGGADFRALVGLGALCMDRNEWADAERAFLAAEHAFPGYAEEGLAAELRLFDLYRERKEPDRAFEAVERWLDWNSGELQKRLEVAAWHAAAGRYEAAERRLAEANEIDPFRRGLHRDWGAALLALDRVEEAAREYHVARSVPLDLEGEPSLAARALAAEVSIDPSLANLVHRHPLTWTEDQVARLTDAQRATLQALRVGDACEKAELCRSEADCLDRLGRSEEARAARTEAESLDAVCNQAAR
jgi:tetratricopeptide (TPR) repeat protein